jgi:hypothetical protein
LHELVNENAAGLPDSESGVPGELSVRVYADGDHGQIAVELGSIGKLHSDEPAIFTEELGDAVVENDVGALAPDVKLDEFGELPVQEGQDLR